MSKFSGKYDFADHVEMSGVNNVLQSDIYIAGQRLDLRSEKDLVPYYPHIIIMSYCDHNTHKSIVHLSEKSWVDIEEERYGHMGMHDYYRQFLREEMAKWENESYT